MMHSPKIGYTLLCSLLTPSQPNFTNKDPIGHLKIQSKVTEYQNKAYHIILSLIDTVVVTKGYIKE